MEALREERDLLLDDRQKLSELLEEAEKNTDALKMQ